MSVTTINTKEHLNYYLANDIFAYIGDDLDVPNPGSLFTFCPLNGRRQHHPRLHKPHTERHRRPRVLIHTHVLISSVPATSSFSGLEPQPAEVPFVVASAVGAFDSDPAPSTLFASPQALSAYAPSYSSTLPIAMPAVSTVVASPTPTPASVPAQVPAVATPAATPAMPHVVGLFHSGHH